MRITRRLNAFLARAGIASRRHADDLIAAGRVKINGKVARIGTVVRADDDVTLDGGSVVLPQRVLFAYYKPRGVTVTMADAHAKRTLTDTLASLFQQHPGLIPVGRLDRESEGLLFLTNDGVIAQELMHPSFEHEKEYEVRVRRPISDADLHRLAIGVRLMEGMTRRAKVKRKDEYTFMITLRQGWKRQIRRMLETQHHDVVMLKRTRIAHYRLGDLQTGTYRMIERDEFFSL